MKRSYFDNMMDHNLFWYLVFGIFAIYGLIGVILESVKFINPNSLPQFRSPSSDMESGIAMALELFVIVVCLRIIYRTARGLMSPKI